MVSVNKNKLIRALSRAGFSCQELGGDLFFILQEKEKKVYGRLDIEFVGKTRNAFILSQALCAVRVVPFQFRGLLMRSVVRELCTEPEHGRVILDTREQWDSWIERAESIAPKAVRKFTEEFETVLLGSTHESRSAASAAIKNLFSAGITNVSLSRVMALLTREQSLALDKICTLTYIVVKNYEDLSRIAVAALLLQRDKDVIRLGAISAPRTRYSAYDIKSISQSAVMKVRILMDELMGQYSAEHER